MINLSDTLPVAVTGGTNIHWQSDVAGNVSAYVSTTKITIAPVAGVLTLDASLANSFLITVNAAITSMTIVNPTDGQEITLLWSQDTTGHAVAVDPHLILGSLVISIGANLYTCAKFSYNAGDNNWYCIGQNGM